MTAFYRVVLLLFPADFRRRHGAAMMAQFDEQQRVVRSRPLAAVGLWRRAVTDAVRHGLALRFGGGRPPRPSAWPSDLRHAWRNLRARGSAAGLSIALLALALTVSTTIFCLVDALILRPAPFPDPHALVEVDSTESPEKPGVPYMPTDLALLWEQHTELFSAAGTFVQGGSALIGGADEARQQVGQVYATPGFFTVLGVRPIAGRTLTAEECVAGNDRVVVISEAISRARFGGAASAIGRSLVVNDVPLTVVGVLPASFGFPWNGIRLWRPLDLAHGQPGRYAEVIARSRPGLDREALRQRVTAAGAGIMPQAATWRYPSATIRGLDEPRLGASIQNSMWLLAAATMLLLVTAGANLSSLTLAQMVARTRIMAIQSALGATRFRLLRQALVEQCLIGLAGFALAVPLTWLAISLAQSLMPERLTVWTMHLADIDLRAMVVMAALAIGTPIAAGLAPALAGSKTSVVALLKHEGRSSTAGRASRLLRQLLVVTEIVCAVVLLIAGSLLVRSFLRLQAVDRGFDTTKLVYASVLFPARDFPSPLSRRLFVDRALAELPLVPGVSAVTLSSGLPPSSGQVSFGQLEIQGHPPLAAHIDLPGYTVRPDFFAVTGIPILQGRSFREDEASSSVIISASMAKTLWPGGSPIGEHFKWTDEKDWMEVVGVAGEVKSDGLDDARGSYEVYFPYVRAAVSAVSSAAVASVDAYSGMGHFIVRADDAVRVVPAIRARIATIDRRVMISDCAPVEAMYGQTLAQQRMLLTLMVVFSCAGLAIAVIGVYGVLSGLVAQQLREISVRIMLGAEPSAMARAVFQGGLRLAGVGAAAGVVVAGLSSRLISSVLFDVHASDPASYLVVLVVIGLAVVLAAWRPARRAARVDPAVLLREA